MRVHHIKLAWPRRRQVRGQQTSTSGIARRNGFIWRVLACGTPASMPVTDRTRAHAPAGSIPIEIDCSIDWVVR